MKYVLEIPSFTGAEDPTCVPGMLLEMDVTECLNLLESPEVLDSKIAEALAVLQVSQALKKIFFNGFNGLERN